MCDGRNLQPSAAILDSWTVQSTRDSGQRAGHDGHKRRKGSKAPLAVDTLGQLLAVLVTPANEQRRAQVAALAEQIQEVTGDSVEVAFVDQGYTGEQAAAEAESQGIRLEVVKLPTAKRGFVLLPRGWVVERSLAWMARFRRLARDYKRLAQSPAFSRIYKVTATAASGHRPRRSETQEAPGSEWLPYSHAAEGEIGWP